MPWHVGKSDTCPPGKPFAVIKDSDSSTTACHATKESAQQQIAALYANESAVRPQLINTGGAPGMLREITEAGAVRAASKSGLLDVQIISPGWGSSGYYSPQVLEAAAANQVFRAGTKMFLDHPTPVEADERPHRSVKDLAAVLAEDARWDGAGLRAQVRTFGPWREAVAEMAGAIGVSIRADAQVSEGEAEGRSGYLIQEITNARSVDFVTEPGRGGQILQVLESARNEAVEAALTENQPLAEPEANPEVTPTPEPVPEPTPETPPAAPEVAPQDPAAAPAVDQAATEEAANTTIPTQEEHMSDEQTSAPSGHPRELFEQRIQQQHRELVMLKARDAARPFIAEAFSTNWLTPRIVARLTEELMTDLPLKGDDLDEASLIVRLRSKVQVAEAEMGEVLEAAGLGTPKGLGHTVAVEQPLNANYAASQKKAFMELGLSEEAADIAVKGR